jgi:hypothetical protein
MVLSKKEKLTKVILKSKKTQQKARKSQLLVESQFDLGKKNQKETEHMTK